MLLPETIPGDTATTVFLPAAAYASDLGIIGGLILNRYRYHPLASPYVYHVEIRLQASTKGLVDGRVSYEQTETFGSPIRSRWTIYGERNPLDNYFGIGNNTAFDSDEWDGNFYYYKVMRGGLEGMARHTVYKSPNRRGSLGIIGTLSVSYEMPKENDENLMGQDLPKGINGGWFNSVEAGILWENRDSEFAATQGNRFELSAEWAPSFLYSDYPMGLVSTEFRQFVTLPVPYFYPVLAGRVAGKWATGSIPYWKRPYLGDEKTLRGYPLYRFRGDAALFYNLELRTWFYEYPHYDIKLGVHGFHDGGRVFYDGDSFDDLLKDYHRTFGAGVAGTFLTPDFILRFDIGFSDEMYRLYMNVGYMF